MQLPADLSEGWWWVRWANAPDATVIKLRYSTIFECWMIVDSPGQRLDRMLASMTALEPVAPPSWTTGTTVEDGRE